MIKFLVTTLLLVAAFLRHNYSHAEIMFGKDCKDHIVHLIENSTNTIDISVYAINHTEIISALLKAKTKNIQIRILTDRLQAFNEFSQVSFLKKNGFNIRLHSVGRIMHHKFAIFDHQIAIVGSFNWTFSASTHNSEDCNTLTLPLDVNTLTDRFNDLWEQNTQEASERSFAKMLNKASTYQRLSPQRLSSTLRKSPPASTIKHNRIIYPK